MTNQTLTRGASLFRGFLKRNGFNPSTASRAIGVTHTAVFEWLAGTKRPAADSRSAIAIWTSGEVSVDDWRTDEERIALGKVLPLKTGTEG